MPDTGISTNFQYTHTWQDKNFFRSQSGDEDEVRYWLQYQPNEIKDAINALAAAIKASNIPFTPGELITEADTVQDAIDYVMSQVQAATELQLADNAVTTSKILNGAVTSEKIGNGEVKTVNIANGAVKANQIDDLAVTGDKLDEASVTNSKIAPGEITADRFDASIAESVFASLDANGKVLAKQRSMKKVEVTADYTLSLSDAGKVIYCNNTSDITITIPTNASVAFPVDTEILVLRNNSGKVTFAKGDATTVKFLNSGKSNTWTVPRQGTAVLLKKLGTNYWWMNGTPLDTASIGDGVITFDKLHDNAIPTFDVTYGTTSYNDIVAAVTGAHPKIPRLFIDETVGSVTTKRWYYLKAINTTSKVASFESRSGNGRHYAICSNPSTWTMGDADIIPDASITSAKLAAQEKLVLTTDMYGTQSNRPANPVTGQLYFQKV